MKIKQVDFLVEVGTYILIFELENGLIVDCFLNEYGYSSKAEWGEYLTERKRLLLPDQYEKAVKTILKEFGVDLGTRHLHYFN